MGLHLEVVKTEAVSDTESCQSQILLCKKIRGKDVWITVPCYHFLFRLRFPVCRTDQPDNNSQVPVCRTDQPDSNSQVPASSGESSDVALQEDGGVTIGQVCTSHTPPTVQPLHSDGRVLLRLHPLE